MLNLSYLWGVCVCYFFFRACSRGSPGSPMRALTCQRPEHPKYFSSGSEVEFEKKTLTDFECCLTPTVFSAVQWPKLHFNGMCNVELVDEAISGIKGECRQDWAVQ